MTVTASAKDGTPPKTIKDGHQCGAKVHGGPRAGQPCVLRAGWGTDHVGTGSCKKHGGNSPGQRKHAQKVMAAVAVATYGLPRDIPPDQALREEHARTVGAIDWLTEIIRAQDPAALTWGLDEETEKGSGEFPGTDRTSRARPSVWVQIYQAERDHLHKISRTMVQLGLDARRVQLAEAQGALVAGAVRAILADLRLTPEQEALVGEVVPRHLRAIAQVEGEVVAP